MAYLNYLTTEKNDDGTYSTFYYDFNINLYKFIHNKKEFLYRKDVDFLGHSLFFALELAEKPAQQRQKNYTRLKKFIDSASVYMFDSKYQDKLNNKISRTDLLSMYSINYYKDLLYNNEFDIFFLDFINAEKYAKSITEKADIVMFFKDKEDKQHILQCFNYCYKIDDPLLREELETAPQNYKYFKNSFCDIIHIKNANNLE